MAQGRGRPGFWAALAFGAIGIVVVARRTQELWFDDRSGTALDLVIKAELALLVLFPYLLYKFTTGSSAPRERSSAFSG